MGGQADNPRSIKRGIRLPRETARRNGAPWKRAERSARYPQIRPSWMGKKVRRRPLRRRAIRDSTGGWLPWKQGCWRELGFGGLHGRRDGRWAVQGAVGAEEAMAKLKPPARHIFRGCSALFLYLFDSPQSSSQPRVEASSCWG